MANARDIVDGVDVVECWDASFGLVHAATEPAELPVGFSTISFIVERAVIFPRSGPRRERISCLARHAPNAFFCLQALEQTAVCERRRQHLARWQCARRLRSAAENRRNIDRLFAQALTSSARYVFKRVEKLNGHVGEVGHVSTD
jgi:hypothetical protein